MIYENDFKAKKGGKGQNAVTSNLAFLTASLFKNRTLLQKTTYSAFFFFFPSSFLLIEVFNKREHFYWEFTWKPLTNSLCKVAIYFLEIYLWRQSNAVLSLLLCFPCLWHTPLKLSHMDGAFKRGIRTELNWITSPLPTLMAAINFANSADGKPIIWWLLCNRIADCSTTECGASNCGRK